jgi:hypothetical protein
MTKNYLQKAGLLLMVNIMVIFHMNYYMLVKDILDFMGLLNPTTLSKCLCTVSLDYNSLPHSEGKIFVLRTWGYLCFDKPRKTLKDLNKQLWIGELYGYEGYVS